MASGLDRPAWGSCTREAEPIKINPIIIIVIIISITIIIISVIIFIIIVLGITRKWSKIGLTAQQTNQQCKSAGDTVPKVVINYIRTKTQTWLPDRRFFGHLWQVDWTDPLGEVAQGKRSR